MNIVYTFDDGYSTITAVSLLSLLENSKNVNNLNIYIVDCGISEYNKNFFVKLVKKYNRTIIFIDGKNLEYKIPIKLDLLYWSFVCYVRLFFCELLPNIDRVLHIDCDTIIKQDFSEIYNIELNDNYCGACYDCMPTTKFAIGMNHNDKYYSNGLILFDLKKMRKDNIQSKFVDYIVEMNGKFPHLDQDVLNVVLKNKIYTLPAKYNVMTPNSVFKEKICELFDNKNYYSKQEVKDSICDSSMLHFVGYRYINKPWNQPCYHPNNKEWIHYYKMLDLKDDNQLLKFKKKKYGLLREILYFVWNMFYKIPGVDYLLFKIEKIKIINKCKKY